MFIQRQSTHTTLRSIDRIEILSNHDHQEIYLEVQQQRNVGMPMDCLETQFGIYGLPKDAIN
jgi:hypothetical protein